MSSSLSHEVYGDAPPSVRVAIAEFRRYVKTCVAEHASKWSDSQSLIQQIAHECHCAMGNGNETPALRPIADMLHVDVVFCHGRDGGCDGTLEAIAGGFRASVFGQMRSNSIGNGLWREEVPAHLKHLTSRGRMTLAHELGHVFFYAADHRAATPRRVVPVARPNSREYRREEGLCTDFARALLLPEHLRGIVPTNPDLGWLLGNAVRYQVSIEVLLRRLMYDWGLWEENIIVVITEIEGICRPSIYRGVGRKRDRSLSAPLIDDRMRRDGVTRSTLAAWLYDEFELPSAHIRRTSRGVLGVL